MWSELTKALIYATIFSAGLQQRAAFAANNRNQEIEVSPDFGATPLNTGTQLICPGFHLALQTAPFAEIKQWYVGDIHDMNEQGSSVTSQKSLNCVNQLLDKTDKKKKKTVILEGATQKTVSCQENGINPNHVPGVSCRGFEPTEDFENAHHAYIFQFLKNHYESLRKQGMNQQEAAKIMDQKIKESYNPKDKSPIHETIGKIIALKEKYNDYEQVFNHKSFAKLNHLDSYQLMELKRLYGTNTEKREPRPDLDFRKLKDPNSPNEIQTMKKRDDAMLATIAKFCKKDEVCIIQVGNAHIDAGQTYFMNIGNEARRVVGQLEENKDENPYAILLQLPDTQNTNKKFKK
jgi:hypothetical protein